MLMFAYPSQCAIAFTIARIAACAVVALALVVPAHAAAKTNPAPVATLDRIKAAGKIVLGYRADAAPMSSRDSSGQPVGYSVALCGKVADALKNQLALPSLAIEWIAVGAGYEDLEQHKVDLLCAADEITLAHLATTSFSIPVFPGGISAVVHRDAWNMLLWTLEERPPPYEPLFRGTSPLTLQYRTFSAINGSATLDVLKASKANMGLTTASVVPVDSYAAGIAALLQHRTDVLFGDRAQLLYAVQRSPDAKDLRVLSPRYEFAASALALPRNDDDFRLAVNRALTGIFLDPQFGALYTATFGAPDADTVAYFRFEIIPK